MVTIFYEFFLNLPKLARKLLSLSLSLSLSLIYSPDQILEIFTPTVANSSTPENYPHHSDHIEEASRGDRGVRKGRFSIHSSLCASAWDFPGKYF